MDIGLRNSLTTLLTLWLGIAAAQFYPLPDISYSWEDERPDTIPLNPQFRSAKAVVLQDDLTISVRGRQSRYLYVYFERKQRIRINDNADAPFPFSKVLIPESHDPFFDARDIPLSERPNLIAADFFNVRMVYFAARKVLGGGETKEISYSDSLREDFIEVNNRFEKQFRYAFNLKDVKPGEEIEIYYKYEVPYATNQAFFNEHRIFFHGQFPIQRQRLEIAVPYAVASRTVGPQPDERYKNDKRDVTVWYNENLPGCIGERSIRPSIDLPHLVFTLLFDNPDERYERGYSYQQYASRYSIHMFQFRERNTLWLRRISSGSGERDPQALQIKNFIDSISGDIPPGLVARRFDVIHSHISNNFSYQWDDAYFAEKDFSLEKIGDQVGQGRLREISRYNLYARLINTLGEKYFTTYILDNRIGRLSDRFTSNILFSDFAFAIPDDEYLSLYYPKKDRYGYEPNEFPFYLSGTPAFFVDYDRLQTEPDYFPELISLPGLVEENYRHTVISAFINSKSQPITGDITVELSGQFSALTRSLYEFGRIDSSINPVYGVRPLERLGATYTRATCSEHSMYPPFKRVFDMDYTVEGVGVQRSNTDGKLSLEGWFNFVTWKDLDPDNRTLPYYVDFPGNDFIRIYLNFDREVSIEDQKVAPMKTENRYGSVELTVSQTEPKQLVIEATFNQYGNRVEPDKFGLIAELHQAVELLEQFQVHWEWVD